MQAVPPHYDVGIVSRITIENGRVVIDEAERLRGVECLGDGAHHVQCKDRELGAARLSSDQAFQLHIEFFNVRFELITSRRVEVVDDSLCSIQRC